MALSFQPDILYDVKPGTQTDTRIRLKNKGIPSLRNSSVRGDHYVRINIHVLPLENRMSVDIHFHQKIASWTSIGAWFPLFTDAHALTVVNSCGNRYLKEALRKFDEASGQSLKKQNGAASTEKHGKKKGRCQFLRESIP